MRHSRRRGQRCGEIVDGLNEGDQSNGFPATVLNPPSRIIRQPHCSPDPRAEVPRSEPVRATSMVSSAINQALLVGAPGLTVSPGWRSSAGLPDAASVANAVWSVAPMNVALRLRRPPTVERFVRERGLAKIAYLSLRLEQLDGDVVERERRQGSSRRGQNCRACSECSDRPTRSLRLARRASR